MSLFPTLDPRTTGSRPAFRAVALLLLVGASFVVSPPNAGAQPVQRYATLEAPVRTVFHDASVLQHDAHTVALMRSDRTAETVAGGYDRVSASVRSWEVLLLGLAVPYEIVDDADLERAIPLKYRVLILPSAESLSARQRSRLRAYMAAGGGILASGRTGWFDEGGRVLGGDFLRDLFGLNAIETRPDARSGLYQSLNGSSVVTQGVDPGYLLNVRAPQDRVMVRRSGVSTVGSVRTYDGRDEAALGDFTMIAAGKREAGRFFWTRFEPADLSRDSDQQEQYQRLVINALSYVSQAPGVSVANWPEGRPMALSVVAISAPGYDPLTWYSSVERFMKFVASRRLHVSYFLPSTEMVAFRPVYARMVGSGAEIGIASVDDRLLTGEALETQIERLSLAASELSLRGVHGVYPPGGFVTAATIRALDRVGADYVLEPRRGIYAPGMLDWWEYAAWNDDFEKKAESGPSASSSARLPSIGVVPMSDPGEDVPLSDFSRARRAGGAFVMPIYPELFDAPAQRSLSDVLQAAEAAGAWPFTASELYRWWRARATLRPEIVLRGPHVIELEVEKATADTLRGVALDVSLPGMPVERMRADQGLISVHADADSETVRIVLSPLIDRRTRISLSWDD